MIMPSKTEMPIRTTGGQVDDMVVALIDAAYDKDSNAKGVMCSSLLQLGKKQPALVLSSCLAYLVKHAKLAQGHRIIILNAMENIVTETLNDIDQPLAVDIIKQASTELTQSKEVVPEWQTAASGVLVALGCRFCHEVMEELLMKFQPGVLPHFFVVQTMANMATANVYGMVPFLKGTLGTMLPMLGMAKMDNMRWVLASALARFCESILDYVANIEKAPDTSVKKEFFAAEIYAAHDVLFNVWLQSREAKLRLVIVEALGQMVHIMSRDKLQEQLPKILPGILSLYKKHHEQYHVTQGVCMVLDAATEGGSMMLDPYLENLLAILFPQMCQPVDYSNPLTVKNHNELLRCFAVIARSFSDKVVAYLLMKIEPVNDRNRIAVLSVIRHLINAASLYMSDKQALVLSGTKIVLQDPNNKVKKVLAQTIIAMAHHGYLELDGGDLMIEFIVRQCALPPEPAGKRPNDPDYVSNDALRSMCENVLHLLSTTVENMDMVLWPYLLECVFPEQYADAIGAVCKAIGQIATRKREQKHDDYLIDFDKQVNIKKPPALYARLLVLAGWPLHGRKRGPAILQALKSISPLVHVNLPDMWDAVIPKLIHHFEEADESDEGYSQKAWEDLLLKFVSKTLDQTDDEDWIAGVGRGLGDQVLMYKDMPKEKNFLYKCLGVVLRRSTKKDLVNQQLDVIFSSVRHTNETEREGCAISVGFVAATHLDAVLTKLEVISKNDPGKRSSGFFNFIKDSLSGSDVDEKTKATLMLAYGFVALYAPPSLIASRLEAVIMRIILPQLAHVKDSAVKTSLIRATELIGRAMQPEHLKSSHKFDKRAELLNYMARFIQYENKNYITSDTRTLAMDASSKLVKLDPRLSDAEILDLTQTSLGAVLSLKEDFVKKGKEETYEDHIEHELLLTSALLSLQELLIEILAKDLKSESLDKLFKQIQTWLDSEVEVERSRAITCCLCLLKFYLEKVDVVASGHFSHYGSLLARIVPRCSDPCLAVRQSAIDCVHTILKIALKHEGKDAGHEDSMVDALPTLKERLERNDATALFSVINDLSKVLCKKVPSDQLMPFLETLFDGLLDSQQQSSSGACVVLKTIVKSRGSELHSQVSVIVEAIHERLSKITNPQTKTGTLRAVRSLCSHHMLNVINELLSHPLPLDDNTKECWQVIGADSTLAPGVIEQLLDMVTRGLPYEEKPDPRDREKLKTIKTATLPPVAATCALTEVCSPEDAEVAVMNYYPRLFACMMIRVASNVDAIPPKIKKEDGKEKDIDINPCKSSIDGLKQVLEGARCSEYVEALEAENVWETLEDPEKYQEGFTILARCMVNTQPQFVSKVIPHLNAALSSVYDSQRVMAAAFFAELIGLKCAGDLALVEMLVNALLGRLVDPCQVVRMLCIRGLGNVASVGPEQVQKYSTTVLSAMMAGMDDKDDIEDDITLEAMNGLSKILAEIDENHIRAILINIALRIRPCFEKEKASVRAASISLFGNLSRFGGGPSKEPFLEQIHTNLVSLLLHLNDDDSDVREACKKSLRSLGPLMGSEAMDTMFTKHLKEGSALHYGEFINDLSKVLIQDFPDKSNFYVMGNVTFFKSGCEHIRSNAAMFTGFLLGNLPSEKYSTVSKEHICNALVLLLKDTSPEVRIKAAEAISWLHDF